MHLGVALDGWIHKRNYEGSDHGKRLKDLEDQWKQFRMKQSEVARTWQQKTTQIEMQLTRMEEHLKYIDRINDSDNPRPRPR